MNQFFQQRYKSLVLPGLLLALVLALCLESTGPSTAQDIQPVFTKPNPGTGAYGPLDAFRSVPGATPADETMAAPAGVSAALDWHLLVYQAYINNNWEIVKSRPDGSSPVILTLDPASDARPALNAAATAIAFNSGRDGDSEIYTMDTAGGSLAQLTSHGASDFAAAWSPDGSRLVFVSDRSGNFDLFTMNADGSNLSQVTMNDQDDGSPSWSPDGSQIVWRKCFSSTNCSIWLMNADGSQAHALTGAIPYLGAPVFAPDGGSIGLDGDVDGDLWNELAVLSLADSSIRILAQPAYANDLWMNAWSADGTWILYTQVVYTIQNNELYIQSSALKRSSLTGVLVGIAAPYPFPMGGVWQLADRQPPAAAVNPLPELGAAAGFGVSWSGFDPGPAGIEAFDVQSRQDETGPWVDWLSGTPDLSGVFTGLANHVYSFRVRARDRAGNQGDWNTNFPGQTRVYTWQLSGIITDNHGNPFPFAAPTVNPAPVISPTVAQNGRYQMYLQADGLHTLAFQKAGYQPLAAQSLEIGADERRNDYLSPLDDVVLNGGFENSGLLAGWQIDTDLAAASTQESHSGSQAALLGAGCLEPCLGEPVKLNYLGASADMAFDLAGNLHYLYISPENAQGKYAVGLYYRQRSPEGIWSQETLITPTAADLFTSIDMVVNPDGRLMVAFSVCSGCSNFVLYYLERSQNGIWSQVETLGGGGIPRLVLDRQGTLHMTHQSTTGLYTYYRTRPPGGTWSEPVQIPGAIGLTSAMGIDASGTIHILTTGGDYLGNLVYYHRISPTGVWSPPVLVASPAFGVYTQRSVSLAVEPNGRLHAFLTGLYTTRGLDGKWTTVEDLGVSITYGNIAVDNQGLVHIIGNRTDYGNTFYLTRRTDGSWLRKYEFPYTFKTDDGVAEILIDPAGFPNIAACGFLGYGCHFVGAPIAVSPGFASVSQAVSLSAALHSPTLSFEYQLSTDLNASGPNLSVLVTEKMTGTQPAALTEVFSASMSSGWELGWADLSRWSGKNITVTFQLTQRAGELAPQLWLDDVSLGSWLTPVIDQIRPYPLDLNTAQVITISGQNFVSGTVVEIGGALIDQVTFSDEHTLRLALPPVTVPGIQVVWIQNPGGQRSLAPYFILFGKAIYLPLMRR